MFTFLNAVDIISYYVQCLPWKLTPMRSVFNVHHYPSSISFIIHLVSPFDDVVVVRCTFYTSVSFLPLGNNIYVLSFSILSLSLFDIFIYCGEQEVRRLFLPLTSLVQPFCVLVEAFLRALSFTLLVCLPLVLATLYVATWNLYVTDESKVH